MLSVNQLIYEAYEDLGFGKEIDGDLQATGERLLNRAITGLNSDNYVSLTVKTIDVVGAGDIVFRKLEDGEEKPSNCIDAEPPDAVQGVSRKIGIRYARLVPSNEEAMDRSFTYSLPTQWCYGVSFETAPSGKQRRVGRVRLNGTYPCEMRVYENSSLPDYKLGDTIYLSPLYHNLILYALEQKMVDRFKLYSYGDKVDLELTKAMKAIDTNTAQNRPMINAELMGLYTPPANDLLEGAGF